MDRRELLTEKSNPHSSNIDRLSIREILEKINDEDSKITSAVRSSIPQIEQAVKFCVNAIKLNRRVFYIGAGTSGRLGVLDASEMPPTYSVPSDWFQGIIAGGDLALRESIEGAEDKTELAINDLDEHNIQRDDVIIGISTSGAAKYVQSALNHGSEIGCKTVYLICNSEPYYSANVDLIIPINVGSEMITGSTRMKSGTATKLALNMISTTTMVKLGKIYGNLMVDLMAVNEKLVDRGIRIIQELTNLNYEDSNSMLLSAEMSVKTAIVMTVKQCNLDEARRILERNNGILRDIID
ncbi:MAG: N-acetylmuramic acid 6-phosphate etherase [Candidatus Neomarinimicrobiota bacterium]|nr:N-acetylmuramic acid 6-phosphate etherase [Candidatus Neomarinimicrobiota bacterium]